MNRITQHLFSPFLSIFRYRELLGQFAKRRIDIQHKGSLLGFLWHFLQPLLMLGLYTFVFGFIFGGSFREGNNESRLVYSLGIFLGLSTFHLLAEVLAISPTILIENKNLVQKVVFPIEILPIAQIVACAFNYSISFLLAIVGILIFVPEVGWSALYSIILFPPLFFLAAGMSWTFAALGVFIRDITSAVGIISMAIMFASGVFYPAKDVPQEFWKFLKFNPLIHLIENLRTVCLWGGELDYRGVGYIYIVSILIFYVGYGIFAVLKNHYSDVL